MIYPYGLHHKIENVVIKNDLACRFIENPIPPLKTVENTGAEVLL
jgi:hypothetical protein